MPLSQPTFFPPSCPFHPADYGAIDDAMPPIADMEQFFKGQLDRHLANGRTPMQISTHYGW